MNSKIILIILGVLLFLSGIIGMLFFGPVPKLNIFGSSFYLSYFEIYTLITLGLIGLAGYYLLNNKKQQNYLVIMLIVLTLLTPALRLFQI